MLEEATLHWFSVKPEARLSILHDIQLSTAVPLTVHSISGELFLYRAQFTTPTASIKVIIDNNLIGLSDTHYTSW